MPVPADGAPGSTRPNSKRWADLRVRVASALVLGPLALAGLWEGGLAWAAVVGIALVGLAAEWAILTRRVWRGQPVGVPVRVATGLVYFVPSCAALYWLRQDGVAGLRNALFLLLVVWASDIGAYVAGRMIGGRKLAPSISPGKTVSGAVGGLAAALVVGLCFTGLAAGVGAAMAAALLLSAVSQAGDLMESAIKRGFDVKDSGRVIPGHGGLLDRLDGLLAAAPVAAGLAIWMGPGMPLWG